MGRKTASENNPKGSFSLVLSPPTNLGLDRLSFLNQAQGKLGVVEALVPSESEFFLFHIHSTSYDNSKFPLLNKKEKMRTFMFEKRIINVMISSI